jgi:hypothetical protein
MERQDDTEQHGEVSGDDPSTRDYPRGRGYGQDYMRGGEVFGGYGYSERPDYTLPLAERRTRGGGESTTDAPHEDERAAVRELDAMDESPSGAAGTERFPQDARAGDWDQPAPAVLPDPNADAEPTTPPGSRIEGTYGGSEGSRLYSRSYYLTQAQLQQRRK